MQRGLPLRTTLLGVKHTIAVASGKGGVGKSSIACNLAVSLSQDGHLVGLLDADLFGPSLPRMMNISSPSDGFEVSADNKIIPPLGHGVKCMSIGLMAGGRGEESPVVWRGLMVTKAIEQLLKQTKWDPIDFLIIDTPPGTGDTLLTINQLIQLTGALLVTTPQNVAVADTRKGAEMFVKMGVPILGLVQNMSHFKCDHCQNQNDLYPSGSSFNQMLSQLNISNTWSIPFESKVAWNMDEGSPVMLNSVNTEFYKIIKQMSRYLTTRFK